MANQPWGAKGDQWLLPATGSAVATAIAIRTVSTLAARSCTRADSRRPIQLPQSTEAKMSSATSPATAVPPPVRSAT